MIRLGITTRSRFRRVGWVLTVAVCAAGALGGCTTSGASTASPVDADLATSSISSGTEPELVRVAVLPPPAAVTDTAGAVIAPNDILEIDVFRVDELDTTVAVDESGRISLPLIGAVEAADTTARELEAEIERLYGASYLQSPDVTVFIKESFGQRATVEGEVRNAGIYPTSSGTSLVRVIALAGGLSDIADPRNVFIFRNYADRRLVAQYDLTAIRKGEAPDPAIVGGDVVVVFASGARIATRNLREALGIATGASGLLR